MNSSLRGVIELDVSCLATAPEDIQSDTIVIPNHLVHQQAILNSRVAG